VTSRMLRSAFGVSENSEPPLHEPTAKAQGPQRRHKDHKAFRDLGVLDFVIFVPRPVSLLL
jgi:hypothetical protein